MTDPDAQASSVLKLAVSAVADEDPHRAVDAFDERALRQRDRSHTVARGG